MEKERTTFVARSFIFTGFNDIIRGFAGKFAYDAVKATTS